MFRRGQTRMFSILNYNFFVFETGIKVAKFLKMACSGLEVEPKPEQENNTLHSQSSFTKVQSNGIHKTIISSFETVKQTNKGLSESSSFDKISELSVCVDQQVAEELTQKKKQVAEELPCTSNIPSEKTTLCALHINKDGGCFKRVNSNKDLAQETSDITCTGMKENIVPTVNDTSTDLKSVEKIFSDFTIEKDCSEDSPTLVKEDDIIDHIVSASKGICYARYKNELQMPAIMHLITKDLSEPYSIYTYRYFIHNWPHLCFLVSACLKNHGIKCI